MINHRPSSHPLFVHKSLDEGEASQRIIFQGRDKKPASVVKEEEEFSAEGQKVIFARSSAYSELGGDARAIRRF